MTKKDYVLIADAIREARMHLNNQECYIVDRVAGSIADKLQADNPRFNRQRFMNACN